MYYIYHIPGVKIGCTKNYPGRCHHQGYYNHELLETHEDGWIAGDREIELQQQYGYPVDKTHYMKVGNKSEYGKIAGRATRKLTYE